MTFDLSLFSSKLKRYREQFEISTDEISQSTGIPKARLVALENREDKPTGDEVLILADYYKCDYQFFISNEKLASFEQTETMFRRYGEHFSKEDRWAVQEFLFLCECEQFLLNLMPQVQDKVFSFTKVGNYYKGHAEEAAKKLRSHLGYASNEIKLDVYHDFRRLGLHIFRRKLNNSNISGLYVKHPVAGKCILVNYSEDVYRQRFTVSHESAHTILDEDDDFIVSLRSQKSKLVEVRANTFASHYLMPPDFIKKIPDPKVWNSEKALYWASQLKVSTEALAYALKNAKLISSAQEQEIKQFRVPFSLKNDPELPESLSEVSRKRRKNLLEKGLSVFYVDLCFEAYEKGLISAARLAEILLADECELMTIAKIYSKTLRYAD